MLVIQYVETCLPCYVNDHCNGDDELLLGVSVTPRMSAREVWQGLCDEWRNNGDKAPAEYTDSQFCTESLRIFTLDGFDKPFAPNLEVPDEDDDTHEWPQAWFRVSWGAPDESGRAEGGSDA